MRAAGIPTRIVTGYQGGTYNRYAGYWIVRESNAHAWDEIWVEGQGWLRVDPTSAVAPSRVEPGLDELAETPLAVGWRAHLPWLEDWRLRLDALGQLWRQRILRFDQLAQFSLLERLGIAEPDAQKIVMVMAAALALAFGWLMWQLRREQRPQPKDPAVIAYARLCKRLAGIGLARAPHEGAGGYAARVARARPDLAATVRALCGSYSSLRYEVPAPRQKADLESFIASVRAFRPRRRAAGSRES
jgi:hypothetical protein